MQSLRQSPTDPAFVQDPYAFYETARAAGPLVYWEDYALPCAVSAEAVNFFLRDRRFGREVPDDRATPVAPHVAGFHAVEAHSMLELEPPRHTRLRGLVLRAFTSRRISKLTDGIAALTEDCLDRAGPGPFDLIDSLARPLPVTTIARLLGVPEEMGPQLLDWSNAMVGMYQARRSRAMEEAADRAARDFAAFIRDFAAQRRRQPADDLITELLAATEDGERLSEDELVTTCILLLNAGHEATVHSFGNGVKALLEHATAPEALSPDRIAATVEEIFRFDPPLHLFTRWCYQPVEAFGHCFRPGDQVGCLLAAANRDPALWQDPGRFDPARPVKANASFGAGIHFCVGAPLARLELQTALPLLIHRFPTLHLTEPPRYADLYHFHGLERLMVSS
jgi:cytochrome P450